MASTRDEADIDDSSSTGNFLIDGLLKEYHWSLLARENFQFTMPDDDSDFRDTRDGLINDYPDNNYLEVFAMPVFMQAAIRLGIAEYSKILNFTISEQGDNNVDTQLRYAIGDLTNSGPENRPAYAHPPHDDGLLDDWKNWMSGDMFFNVDRFSTPDSANPVGTFQYHTILHETGHALGLKHGHEPGDGNPALPIAFDTMEFTVMTYRGYFNDPTDDGYQVVAGHYAQTLMMLDIQALQYLYGADFTTQLGDTTYSWNPNTGAYLINGISQWTPAANVVFMTIWDGGGNDTYDFSNYTNDQEIDLGPGKWSDLGVQLAQLGPNPNDAVQIARGNVFNALQYNSDPRSAIENAIAGSGNDRLTGNFADNGLQGRNGNDTISGLDGFDTLMGGAGNDSLHGNLGDDLLIGGAGADKMLGGAGRDTAGYLSPAGETVTLTPLALPSEGRWMVTGPGEASGDDLWGIEAFVFGSGDDTIILADAPGRQVVSVDGAAGDDHIVGSRDAETLIGGSGSDTLEPGRGEFTVFGGHLGGPDEWTEPLASNDLLVLDRRAFGSDYTLFVFPGSSPLGTFLGSDGADGALTSSARGIARIHYFGAKFRDFIDGARGNDAIRGFDGNDVLLGRDGNDTLIGGNGDDALWGGAGNDLLLGGPGNDQLLGEAGNDRLVTGGAPAGTLSGVDGGPGNDTIIGSNSDEIFHGSRGRDRIDAKGGSDLIYGGPGNDTLLAGDGDDYVDPGLGVESLEGGSGIDRLSIDRSATSKGVSFFLDGTAGSDGTTATGFEVLTYLGGRGDDRVRGLDGNDTIRGNGGDDLLEGGGGHDQLSGGAGADTLRGGPGIDELDGGGGNDKLETGGGGDFSVRGGAGSDTIVGSASGETLDGGPGADVLEAKGGADHLTGGAGNDVLRGGGGPDTLVPNAGNDRLDGGAGNDRFVFAAGGGSDRVIGFDSNAAGGQDLIDVTAFNFADFDAMLGAGISITGGASTAIDFGGLATIVTLAGVSSATIDGSDFLF